ncbi:uncharacterized protein EI90DRAFT_86501 [Cantharellus anzutake]|uniref:uncharacterized protein n=1 Tax=Cantharellus anzutake TaxID=1750568 RepID=UPI0019063B8C|nr:uncharacterized protein EI90DRAFT_86501 [Cantharellus anzutake]KAF8336915.1 hypothetical protein EI90DRAFT_86501 [Cantharellus anzutake]
MLRGRSAPVWVLFLLNLPLADGVWESVRLWPATEDGFARVEVHGTTLVERRVTGGDDRLSSTLYTDSEQGVVRPIDATSTAYSTLETTSFLIPTNTPPLRENEVWVFSISVYTEMAGFETATIYKRPILAVGTKQPSPKSVSPALPTSVVGRETSALSGDPQAPSAITLTATTTLIRTITVATPSPTNVTLTETSTKEVTLGPSTEYVTKDPVTVWQTQTLRTTLPGSPQTSWMTSTILDERTSTVTISIPTITTINVTFTETSASTETVTETERVTVASSITTDTVDAIAQSFKPSNTSRELLNVTRTETETSTSNIVPLISTPEYAIGETEQCPIQVEPGILTNNDERDCAERVLEPWRAVSVLADPHRPYDFYDLWYPHRIKLTIIDAGFRSEKYTLVANGAPIGTTSDFDSDVSNEVHCGRAPKDAARCLVRGFSWGVFVLPAYSRGVRLFTSHTSRFTGLADQSSTVLYKVTSVCD